MISFIVRLFVKKYKRDKLSRLRKKEKKYEKELYQHDSRMSMTDEDMDILNNLYNRYEQAIHKRRAYEEKNKKGKY